MKSRNYLTATAIRIVPFKPIIRAIVHGISKREILDATKGKVFVTEKVMGGRDMKLFEGALYEAILDELERVKKEGGNVYEGVGSIMRSMIVMASSVSYGAMRDARESDGLIREKINIMEQVYAGLRKNDGIDP